MTISKIPFLYQAESGKNNWWRYLITILLTFVVPGVISAVILIIYMVIMLLQSGPQSVLGMENMLNQPLLFLLLLGIIYMFSFMFFYIGARFIHKRSLMSLITIKSRFSWRRIFKGALIWFSILSLFTIISFLFSPDSYQFTFNPQSFGILLLISLIVFPVQAFFEELFFRGYLMQGFGILSKKPIIPLLATSVIFASLHWFNGNNVTLSAFILIDTLIVGLMLGIITLGENSIETAAGIHITNNLYVALINNSPDAGLGNLPSVLTSPMDPYSNIVGTLISVLITLIVIFWGKKNILIDIFRWKDAENLFK